MQNSKQGLSREAELMEGKGREEGEREGEEEEKKGEGEKERGRILENWLMHCGVDKSKIHRASHSCRLR
jgi:hypothetical protein